MLPQQKSVWLNSSRQTYPTINNSLQVDVAIIGGGITGLTAGYFLSQAGKKVVVLDKKQFGCAESGHTTAHLTYVTDERLTKLVANFGKQRAQLAWQGGRLAIDLIEAISAQEQIECNFQRVPNYLHSALFGERDEREALQAETQLATELGFQAEYLPHVPLINRPGIVFADQGLFHPVKYLQGLAHAMQRHGGMLYENSEVTQFTSNPLCLTVNGVEVHCEKLIIATHVPLQGLESLVSATLFQSKLAGYNTYAIGGIIKGKKISSASFYDTSNPYFYLRVENQGQNSYAIFGGLDHKTGQSHNNVAIHAKLDEVLRGIFPHIEIDHHWAGQVIETPDGLPYIGPVNDQQFVATGYAGNGMTFGTLAGLMATEWVNKRPNPWENLLHAERVKIYGAAWNYLEENKDYPLELIKGYLNTPEVADVAKIPIGDAKIMYVGGKRAAVYRQPDGQTQVCSAICTHMGCVVRFNKEESTWDCPCHGSRFLTDGSVMAGPAEKPLATIAL